MALVARRARSHPASPEPWELGPGLGGAASGLRRLWAAAMLVALPACGADFRTATAEVDSDAAPLAMSVDAFRVRAPSLLGRKVKLTGLCVRVGPAASSRDLYLVGDDPGFEVHVVLGGEVNKVSRYSEGRVLTVYGIVRDGNWRHTHAGPTYVVDSQRYERVAAHEWVGW